jgi:RNA polymerase sigma factor (sigma-70 family)
LTARQSFSGEAFQRLLQALSPEPAEAASRLAALLARLQKFFLWSRFDAPDDLAWEVLSRVARKLLEGEPIVNIEAYSSGVARLVAKEAHTRLRRESEALREFERSIEQNHPHELQGAALRSERASGALEACLNELSPQNRDILLRYYEGDEGARIRNRQQLAAQLGISLNALRNRALRLRERMEKSLREALNLREDV